MDWELRDLGNKGSKIERMDTMLDIILCAALLMMIMA